MLYWSRDWGVIFNNYSDMFNVTLECIWNALKSSQVDILSSILLVKIHNVNTRSNYGMTIFDLVFLVAVLGCVVALFSLFYFLLRRQWRRATRISLALVSFLVVYAATLISVALLSPQHVFAMHEDRCFDDWCISAERVVQVPALSAASASVVAHGVFYLVTVRVSSRAKGITQRALDVQVYLLDAKSQRYDPSTAGQQVLDASGQGGQQLTSELTPGASFTRTIVFDMPKYASHLTLLVDHGLFPGMLIIGDEQSILHRPTIINLQIDA
jgi:hypothetical protein